MRHFVRISLLAVVATVALAARPAAQSKPTLKPADYDQFESVSTAAGRGGLSPDGRWLAYGITKVGGDSDLRIAQVGGTAQPKIVPFGTGASFASTSRWIAYGIAQSEAEQERLRTARQPVQRKLGILNLTNQAESIVDGIESFAFDRTGQSIAMKRYAPVAAGTPAATPAPAAGGGRGGPAGGAAAPAAATGTTLIVRNLATAVDVTFGNVTEYAWQPTDTGRLLAMVIGADGQTGNGVQIYDAATSVLRVLESAPADFSGLSWRDDSQDLLVMKGKTDDKRDGPTQVIDVWTGVGTAAPSLVALDSTVAGTLPATQRIVNARRATWMSGVPAGSGQMIMVGVGDWPAKPAAAEGGRGGGGRGATPAAANDKPDVDVWHWNDPIVMARQKLSVAADRRRNLQAVWHVSSNKLVVLGKSFDETISPIRGTTLALVSEFTPYLMDRSIGRGAADVYLADMTTGERTLLKKDVGSNVSASTGGKYAVFADNGHHWTINLATKAVTNITATVKTSFVDVESDSTSPERPMFGVAGWTKGDESIVLYDKYDAWRVAPDGSSAVRVTSCGLEKDPIRCRLLTLAPQPGDPLDVSSPFVSMFGPTTKKSGYGRVPSGGSTTPAKIVWLDKSVTALAKAEKADIYSYSVQDADDSPDIFVGVDIAAAKPMTNTNAFLSKYAWTRAELVDYVVVRGKQKLALQGILHYPADYEPGKKYPMVVYLYEKLSDGLHRFTNPSERDYYNGTALTQNGYFFFQPDIVFTPREPGVSVVECVTAAVNKVIAMGAVDPAKVGVMGHSWGGFDAMYLATHTKLFAAAVSGAGISDLISNYGNHHWSSGIAETDHIETGQQRMVVPLYEDLEAYIRNSAVFGISTMTTPLLLECGDQDGTVFYHQSVELYNIARRAKKPVVMLVYNGEDHGLRVKKNQIDYHRRIGAWFDHYLKGGPAQPWITSGVTALDREGR
jgi:dipeptidyl aminopeptidase/acylaminoacyl peptidase